MSDAPENLMMSPCTGNASGVFCSTSLTAATNSDRSVIAIPNLNKRKILHITALHHGYITQLLTHYLKPSSLIECLREPICKLSQTARHSLRYKMPQASNGGNQQQDFQSTLHLRCMLVRNQAFGTRPMIVWSLQIHARLCFLQEFDVIDTIRPRRFRSMFWAKSTPAKSRHQNFRSNLPSFDAAVHSLEVKPYAISLALLKTKLK